jgi:hypothetical protein
MVIGRIGLVTWRSAHLVNFGSAPKALSHWTAEMQRLPVLATGSFLDFQFASWLPTFVTGNWIPIAIS